MLLALDGILVDNRRSEISTSNKIDEIRFELVSTLKESNKSMTIRRSSFGEIGSKCANLAEEGRRVAAFPKILSSLRFTYITARESAIKKTHKATFEWIFREDDVEGRPLLKFRTWLQEGRRIYWIAGKAGWGKSTLMKFLCHHHRTFEALNVWADKQRLITAKYFFWNAGTDMQNSLLGLMQTLFYHILCQCPHIVETVRPSRCAVDSRFEASEPWTLHELIESFDNLAALDLPDKFCFFIDGLDEYNGEEIDVVEVLRSLASSPAVKLCVSSRPWNAFEKAFGNQKSHMLLLQELTRNDIRCYTTETLESIMIFPVLS